ncbi:hypothetical protein NQ318_002360 [Aromia moschata]|uniref:Calcineurin-like phosphoesterase domain-containing protein n=1 Tax=Aromia moschata TaxID=1265417 RepID=A0AAV8YES6_9CUCU|nr:hypothetical protein NQ318_002360 [Aromia moschata]
MRINRFRRFSKSKIYVGFWLISALSFIIYNEILSYYFRSSNWYNLKCLNRADCTKLLLVADPQIIGNNEEILHFLTPISIFDSDMYLKKTYFHAYNFVQPDIVIFLGDLMDEAHTATDQEFFQYVRRIFNIFLDHGSFLEHVRHIWLPGDNDIGGEDTLVTANKIKRFEGAFSQPDIISVKNITFLKINKLTRSIPVYKKDRSFFSTNQIFVGLSHVPLMYKPSTFVDKVINKMLPHLLFTAHEHKSMILSTDPLHHHEFHIVPVTPDNNQVFKYTLGETDMYEILIPTCSYRMGTTNIGFGYGIIERNELHFTVLWSPSRFHQLGSYLVLVSLFIVCSLFIKCWLCNKCTYC